MYKDDILTQTNLNVITLYMENAHCYNFIVYNEKKGVLDGCVDATYVLYLKNNGRMENIKKQLEKLQPTKLVYIVENEGYKKCSKNLPEQTPSTDLVDGYFQIFNHAKKENYNNILILEDDFIWNDKMIDPEIGKDICTFVNAQDSTFIYYLGCIPFLRMNMGYNHVRTFLQMASHSVIYSKKIRQQMLENGNKMEIKDWDVNLVLFERPVTYCYKSPLCYQTFPSTENQKNWPNMGGLKQIQLFFIKSLKLDKQPSPGFEFFYMASDILCYLLLLLVIFYLYKISQSKIIKKIFKYKILKK